MMIPASFVKAVQVEHKGNRNQRSVNGTFTSEKIQNR